MTKKETKKENILEIQEKKSWFWNENVKGKKLIEYLLKKIGNTAFPYIDLDIRLGRVPKEHRDNYKKIFRMIWEVAELLGYEMDDFFDWASLNSWNCGEIHMWKIEDKIERLKHLGGKQNLLQIKEMKEWISYPYKSGDKIKECLENKA